VFSCNCLPYIPKCCDYYLLPDLPRKHYRNCTKQVRYWNGDLGDTCFLASYFLPHAERFSSKACLVSLHTLFPTHHYVTLGKGTRPWLCPFKGHIWDLSVCREQECWFALGHTLNSGKNYRDPL
jgi:hypothetical protein